MIEEEAGLTIPEIFSRFGESHFRKLEQRIIDRLISPDTQPAEPLVVATGGGMPVAGDNLAKLKQLGTLVYLFADLQTLSSRTASTARPLVNADASTHQERLSQLEKLVASRNPAYRQADHHVDTTGREPGQVAELIIKILLA